MDVKEAKCFDEELEVHLWSSREENLHQTKKQMLTGLLVTMGIRRRRLSSVSSDETLLVSVDEDSVNKTGVKYARKKKPDSDVIFWSQVFIISVVIIASCYVYFHFDHFHFHVTNFYANNMDDHHAQHTLAHKMLKDQKNATAAFELFRRSADKGHPESAYNLAAGHLSGFKTDVQKG